MPAEMMTDMIQSAASSKQLHFVLVHGASHGAWCWYRIRTLIETSGHKVTCLDLKGSGIDPSDPNTIFTLADYNQPLFTFLSSLPPNEKVHTNIATYTYIKIVSCCICLTNVTFYFLFLDFDARFVDLHIIYL